MKTASDYEQSNVILDKRENDEVNGRLSGCPQSVNINGSEFLIYPLFCRTHIEK